MGHYLAYHTCFHASIKLRLYQVLLRTERIFTYLPVVMMLTHCVTLGMNME